VICKTKGVVFRFTRYGETSVIVTIFTIDFGLQSFIVNGVRSKSGKGKIALFQPLTLLELVVYYRENANLNRIKEVKCFYPYHSVPYDFTKSSVAMFIAEVLNKTVKEESHAEQLCEFIISSLISLDSLKSGTANFHLIFLLKLSRFLGFGAQNVNEILNVRVTSPSVETIIETLISADYSSEIKISHEQRREILDLLIQFYYDHAGMSGELKSLQVLREVLM
jgi:DNA repair protein RecO (recombination protein O)